MEHFYSSLYYRNLNFVNPEKQTVLYQKYIWKLCNMERGGKKDFPYAKLILCEVIGLSATRIAFDPGDNVHVNITEKRFVINSAAKIAFILSTRTPKEKYVKSKLSKAHAAFDVRDAKCFHFRIA